MIPKFAVLNVEKRTWFEKEFQLPYGYGHCFVTFDMDKAIRECKNKPVNWVVERIDDKGKEIVFRRE